LHYVCLFRLQFIWPRLSPELKGFFGQLNLFFLDLYRRFKDPLVPSGGDNIQGGRIREPERVEAERNGPKINWIKEQKGNRAMMRASPGEDVRRGDEGVS